ncbi:MAG TPA: hypothetical protein DDW52_30230 [Planctomycetaceae bacterium]|nr:hypothetical protein [Planctomycetaceae bacterium]
MLSPVFNTLAICLLTSAFAVPVGGFLAITVQRTNLFGRGVAWLCIGSQLTLPLYVFAGGWCAMFGTQGWLPALVPALKQTESVGSVLIVSSIHALAMIPWVFVVCSLGLLNRSRAIEETANLEGGWLRTLLRVIVPQLRPWLIAAAAVCCLPVLTEMVVTNLFRVPSVAEQVYLDISLGTVRPWTYVAISLLTMLPVVLGGLLWQRTLPPWREILLHAYDSPQPIDLAQHRFTVSLATWGVIIATVFAPILSLIIKAGWTPNLADSGQSTYSWTTTRFATTVYEGATLFGEQLQWSVLLALTSALVAATFASLLFACTINRPVAHILLSLAMLIIVSVPGPAVAMLVSFLMNRSQPPGLTYLYDFTIAAPVFAQQFRLLPYAWLITIATAASISKSTLEQLKLDGISAPWSVIYELRNLISKPALAGIALLAAISFGELSCSLLVLPAGMTTLSKQLFEFLHFGMRHQDSALCGLFILVSWGMSLLLRKTLMER